VKCRLGSLIWRKDGCVDFLCLSVDFAILSLFYMCGMARFGVWKGGVVLGFSPFLR
jgi:hypothetical protein